MKRQIVIGNVEACAEPWAVHGKAWIRHRLRELESSSPETAPRSRLRTRQPNRVLGETSHPGEGKSRVRHSKKPYGWEPPVTALQDFIDALLTRAQGERSPTAATKPVPDGADRRTERQRHSEVRHVRLDKLELGREHPLDRRLGAPARPDRAPVEGMAFPPVL
jgi:hypothetical protein